MIQLYGWYTQNVRKAAVALEECGLPWELKLVDLIAGEQRTSAHRALNPNAKVPVIVDPDVDGDDPIVVWESGAILIYAAEKSGRLLPVAARDRARVLRWLMWQVSALGPVLGQMGHFLSAGLPPDTPGLNPFLVHTRAPERHPYAVERFVTEARRLISVLNEQLRSQPFVADDYSIADIAIHAWITSTWTMLEAGALGSTHELTPLFDWKQRIDQRPQVQDALRKIDDRRSR